MSLDNTQREILTAGDQYEGSLYGFEGVDGVGKSTAARVFADRIGAELRKSPQPELDSVREYFNSEEISTHSRFLFYLTANLSMSDEVEELVREGEDVVVDRYYPATVAYHNVEAEEDVDFLELAEPYNFLEPDKIFYLSIDEETRLERLGGREEMDHENEENSDYMEEVREEYEEIRDKRPNMVEIEAVDGVENVVENLMSEVEDGRSIS